MAKTKRKSRPPSQASLEALVRYRPQFDALTQLSKDNLSERNSSIAAANTVAAAVRKSLQDARPGMSEVYDGALERQGGIQAGIKNDLAGLTGPTADAIRAAAIGEAAGTAGQLGTARTRAAQDITDQIGRVGSGQQQAVLQANQKFAENAGKIGSQRTSLAAQLGDFEQLTGAKLAKEERDRLFQVDQKNIDREISLAKSGLRPDGNGGFVYDPSLKPAKAKGAGKTVLPGGTKLATATAHGNARDTIEKTLRWIKEQRSADPTVSRHELASELVDGAPAVSHVRRATKKEIQDGVTANGEKVSTNSQGISTVTEKIPAVKAVDPDLVSAALDLGYDGAISHGQPGATTAEKLHLRGLSVRQLGYGLTDHSKPKKKSKSKPKAKPSSNIFAFPGTGG